MPIYFWNPIWYLHNRRIMLRLAVQLDKSIHCLVMATIKINSKVEEHVWNELKQLANESHQTEFSFPKETINNVKGIPDVIEEGRMITSHVKNIDITELIDAIGLNETQKKPHGGSFRTLSNGNTRNRNC